MYNDIIIETLLNDANDIVIQTRKSKWDSFLEIIDEWLNSKNELCIFNLDLITTDKPKINRNSFYYYVFTNSFMETIRSLEYHLKSHELKFSINQILPFYENELFIEGNKILSIFNLFYPIKHFDKLIPNVYNTIIHNSLFSKFSYNLFSYDIHAIRLSQILYSPQYANDWNLYFPKLIFLLDHIQFQTFDDTTDNIIISTFHQQIINILDSKFINRHIYLYNLGTKRVCIGLDSPDNILLYLQDILKDYLRNNHIIYTELFPKIPFDLRLRRFTFYIIKKGNRFPILDIWNSTSYELIPTFINPNNCIVTANTFVLLRFLLIDLVSLFLFKLTPKLEHIIHNKIIHIIKTDVLNQIYDLYNDKTINIYDYQNIKTYYGIYEDELIYKKILAISSRKY